MASTERPNSGYNPTIAAVERKCIRLLLEDDVGQTPIHRDWQAGEQEQ
jgi:hypothetical protein